MTSVSQLVPTFSTGGISDQPDELKKPGQVRDAVNVYPDLVYGLQKRPGLDVRFVLGTQWFEPIIDGTWFHFSRPQSVSEFGRSAEFLGVVAFTGDVHVWNIRTGATVKVFYSPTSLNPLDINETDPSTFINDPSARPEYLIHESPQQIKCLTVNDYTFFTNPRVQTSFNLADNKRPYEAFIEVTQLAYGREYLFDIDILSTEEDSEYKTVVTAVIEGVGDFGSGDRGGPECAGNFNRSVTVDNNFLTNGTEDTGQGGLVLNLTSTGTAVLDSNGSNYECKYRHEVVVRSGGFNWNKGDQLRYYQIGEEVADSDKDPFYDIKITKIKKIKSSAEYQIVGASTPVDGDTTVSVREVIQSMRDRLVESGAIDLVEKVGNGLYLRHSEPFTVTTSEKDLMNILCNEDQDLENPVCVVNNVSNLPLECRDGLVVKVNNTFAAEDDYWVQFNANYGDVNFDPDGPPQNRNKPANGYWVEIAQPLGKTSINPQSMPHSMFYAATPEGEDRMVVAPVDWNDRECGTDDFNPSFEGTNINSLLYFRNRLVALSQEHVIMSQAGDLWNWFPKTALTVSPTDPIDIAATTNFAALLHDGIVINNGLVVFSDYQQFLVTTDSDILDPSTAKISTISSYDYDRNSTPFRLGDSIGFRGKSTGTSKFYQMITPYREGPVEVIEKNKIVSKSMPAGLVEIASSNEIGIVLAGKVESNEVWGYKYFTQGQNQLQDVWFRWEYPYPAMYHFFFEGIYYAVCKVPTGSGDRTILHAMNLAEPDKAAYSSVTTDGAGSQRYTDSTSEVNGIYDPITDTTRFFGSIPASLPGYDTYATMPDGSWTKLDNSDYPPSAPGKWIYDEYGEDIGWASYGYGIKMEVKLPYTFLSKSEPGAGSYRADTTASLVIHRMKFNFSETGAHTFTIERQGRDTYNVEQLYEQTPMDDYKANINPVRGVEQVLPVYCRNTDLDITLKSSLPVPCSLDSMRWEGDYNQRYYRRV